MQIYRTSSEFEEQLLKLKDKMSGLKKQVATKTDETVFSMAVAHRKEMDDLYDGLFHLKQQIEEVRTEREAQVREKYHHPKDQVSAI
ncbi:hypothetical protein [Halobacillus sp. B29]|uniref:hypothetical protein n=1 Tax=Halobacillus sp. B29 TaxID=3457432 RepID=UPI003FCDD29D